MEASARLELQSALEAEKQHQALQQEVASLREELRVRGPLGE